MIRQEQKFFLNPEERSYFLSYFNAFMHYPPRRVNSIYFDDSNFNSYKDSEEGTVPRKKYRLRWYGNTMNIPKEAALEIKTTHAKYKTKEVFKIKNFKKLDGLFFKITKKQLHPVCSISYDRLYYINRDNIRFTYDTNITSNKLGNNKIALQNNIFEIKFNGDDKCEFTSLLGDANTRYSKYNEAMDILYNVG